MQNEHMTGGQEIAFGDGAPGQSWLARATFGMSFCPSQSPYAAEPLGRVRSSAYLGFGDTDKRLLIHLGT